jgi:hypothetical protein
MHGGAGAGGRAVPTALPLLIRKRKYTHQPGGPPPTTEEFLALLAAALEKKVASPSRENES